MEKLNSFKLTKFTLKGLAMNPDVFAYENTL